MILNTFTEETFSQSGVVTYYKIRCPACTWEIRLDGRHLTTGILRRDMENLREEAERHFKEKHQ